VRIRRVEARPDNADQGARAVQKIRALRSSAAMPVPRCVREQVGYFR
jgi:hypothetical protein